MKHLNAISRQRIPKTPIGRASTSTSRSNATPVLVKRNRRASGGSTLDDSKASIIIERTAPPICSICHKVCTRILRHCGSFLALEVQNSSDSSNCETDRKRTLILFCFFF